MKTQKRIKKMLNDQKKSVEDLAEAINKDKSTVYRYLNGAITSMPVTIVQPIADYLQTTPAYIMGWTDDANNYDLLYSRLGKIIPDDFLPNLDEHERKKHFVIHQFNLLPTEDLEGIDYRNVLSTIGLSDDEINLIRTFRKLNIKTQSKLIDYAHDMLAINEVEE